MAESSSSAHVISPPRLRKKGTEGPSGAATELVAKARLVQQLITQMPKQAPRRALNQPMSTVLDAGRAGLTRHGIKAAMNVLSGIAKAARQNAVNDEAAMAAVNKALSATRLWQHKRFVESARHSPMAVLIRFDQGPIVVPYK